MLNKICPEECFLFCIFQTISGFNPIKDMSYFTTPPPAKKISNFSRQDVSQSPASEWNLPCLCSSRAPKIPSSLMSASCLLLKQLYITMKLEREKVGLAYSFRGFRSWLGESMSFRLLSVGTTLYGRNKLQSKLPISCLGSRRDQDPTSLCKCVLPANQASLTRL